MSADDQTVRLRPATPQDLDFTWGLYRELMKPLAEELLAWNDARQKQVVEREVLSGQASIILKGGQDVGWLHVRETPEAVELCQLYILPEFQNRGIGTSIVQNLIDRSRQSGKTLTLEVMRNNPVRALYERLGFVRTGESAHKLEMTWREGRGD